MHQIFKSQQGFNMLEFILVVGIFVILSTSAASLIIDKPAKEDLDAKARETVDIITRARNYAMTGYRNDEWGIKVLNNHADCISLDETEAAIWAEAGYPDADCVFLFKGSDWSTRDTGFEEKVSIDLSFPPPGSGVYIEPSEANEFYFNKISGWLTTTTAKQTIILKSNYGAQKTVTTTRAGLIYYGN